VPPEELYSLHSALQVVPVGVLALAPAQMAREPEPELGQELATKIQIDLGGELELEQEEAQALERKIPIDLEAGPALELVVLIFLGLSLLGDPPLYLVGVPLWEYRWVLLSLLGPLRLEILEMVTHLDVVFPQVESAKDAVSKMS
jgi:hypothetical protein